MCFVYCLAAQNHLERRRHWNVRSTIGTARRAIGIIWNYLERPQGNWNCAKRIILVLNATISPLWGVGGGIGVLKNFNFWGERKPKSPQLLQSSRSCDLSAEREVDAGNR